MSDGKIVWSSHPEKFMKAEEVEQPGGLPPKGQVLRLRRENQGRGGKTVTTIYEFQASDRQREELARELKKRLSTGGTVKDNIIVLQGDRVEAVTKLLTDWGYKPKKSGG